MGVFRGEPPAVFQCAASGPGDSVVINPRRSCAADTKERMLNPLVIGSAATFVVDASSDTSGFEAPPR